MPTPGCRGALEALIREAMRGDPQSPLLWTTRSLDHLAGELTAQGHPCSPGGLRLAMRRAGYTLQSNSRAQEGRQHPERDGPVPAHRRAGQRVPGRGGSR